MEARANRTGPGVNNIERRDRISTSKQLGWIAVGTMAGGAAGVAWGWFGSGGYEANNSMIGTGFLCALLGALLTAIFVTVLGHRRASQPGKR